MGGDSVDRLALLKSLRTSTGLTLDFWADLTDGLPYSSLAILCGNASASPKNKNSNESP